MHYFARRLKRDIQSVNCLKAIGVDGKLNRLTYFCFLGCVFDVFLDKLQHVGAVLDEVGERLGVAHVATPQRLVVFAQNARQLVPTQVATDAFLTEGVVTVIATQESPSLAAPATVIVHSILVLCDRVGRVKREAILKHREKCDYIRLLWYVADVFLKRYLA